MAQLVSAGDDIKIWDCNDFVLSQQFNPHDQNVTSVCWAADNSFLASGSIHAENIVLTDMKSLNTNIIQCESACMCLDINDTSRYMLAGGASGIISVWDLKTNKFKKSYKDHKVPVKCAKFNEGATSIASGSEAGEIILYNVVTGQGCRPLLAQNVRAIQEVQYNRFKKSLLGSVSDDGSLNLWDCNTRQCTHSATCHRAPATGLSFSTINEIFLITVGLDKRIACHDLTSKKVVKVINVDSPLTSVDAMSNGVGIAVGSSRGKIYHYDLRNTATPLSTIDAHKSSVQALRFQLEPGKNDRSSHMSSKAAKAARHLPASPKPHTDSGISANHTDMRATAAGGLYGEVDVFSPVREGYLDHSSSIEEMDSRSGELITNTTSLKNGSTDAYSAGGVFSPLADHNMDSGSFGNSASLGMSPLVFPGYSHVDHNQNTSAHSLMDYNRMNTEGSSPAAVASPGGRFKTDTGQPSTSSLTNGQASYSHATPLTAPRDDVQQSGYRNKTYSDGSRMAPQKQVAFVTEEPDSYTFCSNNSSPSYANIHQQSPELTNHRHSQHRSHSGMSASPSLPTTHLDDSPGSAHGGVINGAVKSYPITPDGVNAQTVIVPNCLDIPTSDKRSVNLAGEHSRLSHGDATQIAQIVRSVIQEELGSMKKEMRSVMKDEVDELVEQIHRDIINLQATMLLEFQTQQSELINLLQHYSVNQDLVTEVHRLQDEVKRLQKNF